MVTVGATLTRTPYSTQNGGRTNGARGGGAPRSLFKGDSAVVGGELTKVSEEAIGEVDGTMVGDGLNDDSGESCAGLRMLRNAVMRIWAGASSGMALKLVQA